MLLATLPALSLAMKAHAGHVIAQGLLWRWEEVERNSGKLTLYLTPAELEADAT